MARRIVKVLFSFIVVFMSVVFLSCNDEKTIDNKETEQKAIIDGDIPDGYYVGYYYLDNNSSIEIREYIENGTALRRWLNGKEQDIRYAPKVAGRFFDRNDNKKAQDKAIDVATRLAEKYPCVSIIGETHFDTDMMVYTVFYETSRPCEYEKYQTNK